MEVGKTFIYPLAAYSRKYNNISQVPLQATVAIPNDPSNEGRALLLLHNAGLIRLKNPNNLFSTPLDIEENSLNLRFFEVEAAQLPRTLEDTDLSVINTTFASSIGLKPKKDGLILEDYRSPYSNIIVVKDRDREKTWVELLIKSFQDEKVLRKAEEIFEDNVIAVWGT